VFCILKTHGRFLQYTYNMIISYNTLVPKYSNELYYIIKYYTCVEYDETINEYNAHYTK